MTPDEVRELNRQMFETFKPEYVMWVDALSGPGTEGAFFGGDGADDLWNPAESVDDVLPIAEKLAFAEAGDVLRFQGCMQTDGKPVYVIRLVSLAPAGRSLAEALCRWCLATKKQETKNV